MDDLILGVCPTCYMLVKESQPNVQDISHDETIAYHRECEPRRMQYMKNNAERWKENGLNSKFLREKYDHTLAELAEHLQVSESKLRKFEAGKPVTHAALLGTAIIMYFKLFKAEFERIMNAN